MKLKHNFDFFTLEEFSLQRMSPLEDFSCITTLSSAILSSGPDAIASTIAIEFDSNRHNVSGETGTTTIRRNSIETAWQKCI